jgi:hypothetical protein
MEMVWKGIVGGLITAAIVWCRSAATPCPASCRYFRPWR